MKSESGDRTQERGGDCANCPNSASRAQAELGKPGRRRFLNYLLGTGVVGTAIAILYPVLKFITPPHLIEAAQNTVTAGTVSEMALNSGKIFKFGTQPGLLIRSATGEYKAFSAVCTHLDCIVQYQPEKKQIWCACHNGEYNLSGQNVGGPPPRPLEEYVVNTRGDEIIVSKG